MRSKSVAKRLESILSQNKPHTEVPRLYQHGECQRWCTLESYDLAAKQQNEWMNDCELSGVATAKVTDADKQPKPNTPVQVAMDMAEATTIGDIQKLIFAGAVYICPQLLCGTLQCEN